MNTKGMEIFNAKNGSTDLNIEIQSSKGSTQMFFNQEVCDVLKYTIFAAIGQSFNLLRQNLRLAGIQRVGRKETIPSSS